MKKKERKKNILECHFLYLRIREEAQSKNQADHQETGLSQLIVDIACPYPKERDQSGLFLS